jgi:hypothetical protein
MNVCASLHDMVCSVKGEDLEGGGTFVPGTPETMLKLGVDWGG